MTPSSLIFGLVFSILTLSGLIGLVAILSKTGTKIGLSAELQRKLVHVAVGLFALPLPLFLDRTSFAIFALLGFIILVIFRLPIMRQTLSRSVHCVERQSWGDVLLLVSVSVLFFSSGADRLLYILPLAIITLSDASAALVGTQYGQRKFGPAGREKSLEGSAIFFLVSWVVTVTILILVPHVARQMILPLATIIAAFSTLVEASSWRGLDNLFVPIGIYALLAFNPQNPLLQLALAALFILVLILSAFSARLFGLTRHACRCMAICLFLTIGLTSFFHALFALAALAAYLPLRRQAVEAEGQDLELVVILTLIGVFWLLAGNITELNAVSFYMMNFAAILSGFIALHFAVWSQAKRLLATVLSGIFVFFLYVFLLKLEAGLPLSAFTNHILSTHLLAACAIGATTMLGFLTNAPLRHMPYRMAIPASLICGLGFFTMGTIQ